MNEHNVIKNTLMAKGISGVWILSSLNNMPFKFYLQHTHHPFYHLLWFTPFYHTPRKIQQWAFCNGERGAFRRVERAQEHGFTLAVTHYCSKCESRNRLSSIKTAKIRRREWGVILCQPSPTPPPIIPYLPIYPQTPSAASRKFHRPRVWEPFSQFHLVRLIMIIIPLKYEPYCNMNSAPKIKIILTFCLLHRTHFVKVNFSAFVP